MELYELFNKPLEWEWDNKTSTRYVARFEVSRDLDYVVWITKGSGEWEVWFKVYGEGYEQNKSALGIINKGVGIAVFSTVAAILKEFIKEQNPKTIFFTADTDEPSRVKLYDRLSTLFTDAGYTVDKQQDGHEIKYKITSVD